MQVHVLGAGKGESIVLGLPDGNWGVVDCYTGNVRAPDANPTLQFLRSKGVTELEFVCLTHPHDDHYKGMSHLFAELKVAQFWRFGSWSRQQLKEMLVQLGVEAARGDKADAEALDDLQKTFRTVAAGKGKAPAVSALSDVKLLHRTDVAGGAELSVWGIAPSTALVEKYQQAILRHLLWSRDPAADPDEEPPLPRHNNVSAALLVRYGETCLILGGDVEESGWEHALAALRKLGIDPSAHFVKVSHHGSTNGYCDGLWSTLASDRNPVAAITLYRSKGLPREAAVRHIALHTKRILVTCRNGVEFGSRTAADLRFWPDWDLGTTLAASAAFHSFVANTPEDLGICSVDFNPRGVVERIVCDGAADALVLDQTSPP